jgi:hypothetical protein
MDEVSCHSVLTLLIDPRWECSSQRKNAMTAIKFRPADLDGFNVFFREAGQTGAPNLLLLRRTRLALPADTPKRWDFYTAL